MAQETKSEPKYNSHDVQKVSRALIECFRVWEPAGNSFSDYDKIVCACCEEIQPADEKGKFPHKLDCPVLIAQDLLTNAR